MKINFWQIIGLVLIIAGVVVVARNKLGKNDTVPQPTTTTPAPVATQPAP
jgi:drug/metabolite transporter (DMT)-like permease